MGCLAEQPRNLLRNPRDDRAVENSGKGSHQQCAQYYGDNDLHGIRDVEVAALVGECLVCPADGAVEFAVDCIVKIGRASCRERVLLIV